MIKNQKIGFIGAGNMAAALIKGIVQSGVRGKEELAASDKDPQAIKNISDRFGIMGCSSNMELVNECPIVILSVKPQNMKEVLEEIREEIRGHHLLVSIAAGISLEMIHDVIGMDIPLIRVMPNTPSLVQKGVSALAGGVRAAPEHMDIVQAIFQAVGDTVSVDESMMDAVTALSGSGPGYVFRIMECMVSAGVSSGLDREISRRLVVQTFLGSACLAKESGNSLSRLREMVTSPGGTTAAGLAVFERMGLEKIIRDVVDAAFNRSLELGGNK